MLHLHADYDAMNRLARNTGISANTIPHIGDIDIKASANGTRHSINAETCIESGIGNLTSRVAVSGENASVDLNSNTLRLGNVINGGIIGDTELSACHIGNRPELKEAKETRWKADTAAADSERICLPQYRCINRHGSRQGQHRDVCG